VGLCLCLCDFVSSLGHLSGPVLLPGFRHIATYFLISWLVSSPPSQTDNFFQPFIDDIVQQLIHAVQQDYWSLIRRSIRASTFVKLRIGAVHRFSLSTCVFCQNFIHPHFNNLELLVRHRFCEFIRASVRTCAFAWLQTQCDIFLHLMAGEFSSESNSLVDALLSYKCQSVLLPSKARCLSRPCCA